MIAEIGLLAMLMALLFAGLLTIVPSIGLIAQRHKSRHPERVFLREGSPRIGTVSAKILEILRAKRRAQDDVPAVALNDVPMVAVNSAGYYVLGQCLFIALAYLCLSISFLQDDFTLSYVANNSSQSLPSFYKLCALWGGHEGSMLLWITILSGWMLLVQCFSKHLDPLFRARVLVVLGALSVGFIAFLLFTSNPFLRNFQNIGIGRDLNPLLQDPGFLFHPPMLYMGYVGFSVAFAFAIAALWMGEMQAEWAKWARPWTLAAWCCLSLGITLGSWWAYRELGWGGWWFWDPVENASFMPWLVGTALVHSLMVCEKRGQFIAWTLLLAITAFSLSLIGTFLVRSGVLTSVHAFAVDPERGIYILAFLLLVIGGSLLLFSLRIPSLQRPRLNFWFSRESALLLNNVFLIVIMLTVLMGTLYPLLIDALNLGKISVGAPYFNAVFVPLMVPFLLLMGLGIQLNWQRDAIKKRLLGLLPTLSLAVLLPLVLLYFFAGHIKGYTWLGLSLASWILLSTLKLLGSKLLQRGLQGLSQSFLGMVFAHSGIAVTVIGIAVSTGYGIQDDVKMSIGDVMDLGSYQIAFDKELPLRGANYHGTQARFIIRQGNKASVIYPEKRIYEVGNVPMTDAAIDLNPFRDIYIALGEPIGESAWSVRLYYKPFVRWIWAGGFMIFIGGLLALSNRRYYQ